MHLSLREAKKDATRARLAEATYEIVRTQGPDHLTAEAVATMAGVSRRTFFNYFPRSTQPVPTRSSCCSPNGPRP